MKFSLCVMLVTLLSACLMLQAQAKDVAKDEAPDGNVKTLKYQTSVKEIVKDLIMNWNSPLVYLRSRGYLSPPQLNFDMFRKEQSETESNHLKPRLQRAPRSNVAEASGTSDLGQLFRTLFSSDDNSASDKIKSKLDVPWDMVALKDSVRNKAMKFYEKFYNKRNEQPSKSDHEVGTDIDKQVAQMYPSVISSANDEHKNVEQKKEAVVTRAQKEAKYLNGIAKLLTNRDILARSKPLPLLRQEQKKAIEEPTPGT